MKNVNYKKILLIAFVIMAVLLTSCQRNSNETSKTPSDPSGKDPQITVIMPIYAMGDQSDREKYSEEILRNQGFNIKFDVFYDPEAGNSSSRHMESYMKYCEQKLASGSDVICIVRDTQVERLSSKGLIKDITDDYINIAPEHYTEFFGSEKQKVYGIPADIQDIGKEPYRWAVLLKNEIADAYGKEIRSVKDYEDFLYWAHDQYPKLVPGLFPVLLYDSVYYNGYTPFDFFAPEYGYYPVGEAFIDDDAVMVYVNLENSSGEPALYPAEAIPEFKEALMKYYNWQKNYLVEYRTYMTTRNQGYDINRYASLVINTGDYSTDQLDIFFPNTAARINAADYKMYILYPQQIPNTMDKMPNSYWRGVAPIKGDPSAFIHFISWLHETPENYETFHYGVIDTDYKKENDRLTILDTGIDYPKWAQLNIFLNESMHPRYSHNPSNWDSEMKNVKYPEVSFIQELKDNHAKVKEFIKQNPYSAEILKPRFTQYEELCKALYLQSSNNPEALIHDFINNKSLLDSGKYLVNRYKDILNDIK